MNILQKLIYLSLSTTLLLAGPMSKKDPEIESVIQTGKQSSKILLKTLGKNMKQHMKSGGPMNALDFCSNEAYDITKQVNQSLAKNVEVKRISSKYRSPVNKPTSDELAVLDSFANMKAQNILLPKYLVQKVDSHTYKFYKPLTIKKQVCLKCHGNIENMPLKKEIESRYPQDKATGYKMNDLRGAVVVTIKK